MARRGTTIRLTNNKATSKIEKLQHNVPGVTRRTLYEAAVEGQKAIAQRMYESHTETGRADVARGFTYANGRMIPRSEPGRYRTGDMIRSVERQSLTGRPMQTRTGLGRTVQKIGVDRPLPYMKYQEVINDMRAIQYGGRVFMQHILTNMQAALREAGKDAQADRLSQRIDYWS